MTAGADAQQQDTPAAVTDGQKVVVWTKPACQQCRLVKFRLEAADVPYIELDLTAEEHAKDLEYFKGLGFSSAPITEYGGIAVPGFMPSEIDRVIVAYQADEAVA
jgi:glutaredoxin-like protein NrdH